MHKQLENYLDEVAKSLGSLPAARLYEEIREMRQHLLNAVVIGKEQGHSEDEAISAVVKQFGTPQAVSKQIVLAWRRGVWRDRRDLWGSIACAFVLSFSLGVAADLVFPVFINHFGLVHFDDTGRAHFSPWLGLVRISWVIAYSAVQGTAIGALFPRNAVKVAPAGMIVSVVLYLCLMYHFAYLHHERIGPVHVASAMSLILRVLIAALFARASSRWRKARGERRAQARLVG